MNSESEKNENDYSDNNEKNMVYTEKLKTPHYRLKNTDGN